MAVCIRKNSDGLDAQMLGSADYSTRDFAAIGDEDFVISRGMRIAQMVIAPVARCRIEPVEALPVTMRGDGGFGSTGV